jgi:uncharacterized protein with NRDE domain
MCILALIYQSLPDCPLFVLTNRDESTARPSLSPRAIDAPPGKSRWFGGVDAQAGGTWFGVNRNGVLAAITNRRKSNAPPDARSRGLLCRDVLFEPTAMQAVDRVREELALRPYAGFNLVIASAEAAWVIEAVDELVITRLDPGVHCVGNWPLAAVDEPRIARTRAAVTEMLRTRTNWQSLVAPAKDICAIHEEGNGSGLCLHRDDWGTVSSTICALPRDPAEAEYHYAPGPPCRTLYLDCSADLQRVLSEPRDE